MLDEEGRIMLARGMGIDLRLAYKNKKNKIIPCISATAQGSKTKDIK